MAKFDALKDALQNFKESLTDSIESLIEVVEAAEEESEVEDAPEPVLYAGFVNVYADENRPQGVRFGNRLYTSEEAAKGGQKSGGVAIASVSFEK